MIIFILEYLFLFATGAMMGWCLEVVYRRYFGLAKKWINPGFLSGPYLPLYGTGVCLLYIVSDWQIPLGAKILLFAVVTTAIEYVTGVFFLKFYNTRLWDYSNMRFNFQGIISPVYSCFWTLLSLFFYYVLYPYFYQQVTFLYENLQFSLFVGIFYGVAGMDVIQSFNVLNRLKEAADAMEHSNLAIHYDQLKLDITERFDEFTDKVEEVGDKIEGIGEMVSSMKPKRLGLRRPTYLHPFSGDYNLKKHMTAHFEKLIEQNKDRRLRG